MEPREKCDDGFAELLQARAQRSYTDETLRHTADVVMGLWPDLRLAYMNPAWFRFADENGGGPAFARTWPLGRSLVEALPDVLRPHYEEGFERCLRSGEPWHEDYECSSPDVYRLFHAVTYPIGDAQGLLSVHSLRLERPHTRVPEAPDLALFANEHGFVAQCSYCRRFRLAGQSQAWSWVPEWLRSPPSAPVTHGICGPCSDHHFGQYQDKK